MTWRCGRDGRAVKSHQYRPMWYKSTIIRGLAATVLIALAALGAFAQAGEPDPVLEYYWRNAGQTAAGANPNQAGVAYRLTVK